MNGDLNNEGLEFDNQEKSDQPSGNINAGDVSGTGIAIGHKARVEINNITEIIVRPDSIEDVPPAPGDPPYKGLAYFSEEDAPYFFGREEVSEQIIKRLRKANFLAVIGASGSGKSSLLRAGVIPPLREQNWFIRIMTPTARPLERLANVLTTGNSPLSAAEEIEAALAKKPDTLHRAANRLITGANATHMLLVIDQLEELFTLCQDGDERAAFVANLLDAASKEGTLAILIGLRADFYGHTTAYDGLRLLVSGQQELVGPMRQEDLVRVIGGPAKKGGWQLVEGLVETILRDTAGEPGYLPLLSHALRETWEKRRGTVMTLGGYEEAGGVEGAIAQTADKTVKEMKENEIAIVRHVFLSLTALNEGAENTRRIATGEELYSIDADQAVINQIVEELVDARLITVENKPDQEDQPEAVAEAVQDQERQPKAIHKNTQIQVAHEALIRHWPTLQIWIDEDRERLSFFRRLSRAAQEWQDNGRQPDYVFQGARLDQAKMRIDEYNTWKLTPQQMLFIDTSIEVAEKKKDEEEKEREKARQEARRATNFAMAGGAIGLGLDALLIDLLNPEIVGFFPLIYVIFAAAAGAFVGYLYVSTFDSVVATASQRNKALAWPAGILVGVLAFSVAAYILFLLLGESFWVILLLGSAWGAAAGAGRFWIRRGEERPKTVTIPLVAFLCGIILMLVYTPLQLFEAAKLSFNWWLLFVIGALPPLAILLAEMGTKVTVRGRNR